TNGKKEAAVWQTLDDAESRAWPRFRCLHDHCKDRRLPEVLACFDPAQVDAHCARTWEPKAAGYDGDDLARILSEGREDTPTPPPAEQAKTTEPTPKATAKLNLAGKLICLALQHGSQFVADGKAYVKTGRLCFPVTSTSCRRWLSSLAVQHLKQAANDK